MKKTELRLIFFCFNIYILVLSATNCSAQQVRADSIILQKAVSATVIAYQVKIDKNLGLFNGTQYSFVTKQSYGFPFWGTDSLISGNICYDKNNYNNVPLKYDLVNQAIVTTGSDHNSLIALINEKVQNFTLNSHQFFRLCETMYPNKNVVTGFYDRLYCGGIVVWAKRKKELRLSLNAEDQAGNFKEFDQYFIQMENAFYEVKDKKDFLFIFKDKKETIQHFIKEHKTENDFEQILIKVAAYYDQIK